MEKESKIYIAGHKGLVGSAIERVLKKEGYENILGKTHAELDLTEQSKVNEFFEVNRPEYVFLAAAKVGGIHANNTYPAEFIFSNIQIQNNVIDACYRFKTKKLLFLGSSCIYPKFAKQPMDESQLLDGKLEPTNEPYAVAKIAGIVMCQSYNRQYGTNFISVMPTNLYGPGDNYHPENSHVLPALIRRFYEAKIKNLPEVVVWGTGKPLREFLYSDDMGHACVF
ncbi:GDP-L-fucose synthetase domain protein [Leptospira interrogans serovar Icterohaemorrhagiae str. Verdun HP]|nr:GDP-L-fucose synthetase domain protein [Leptospira interrogans serovar Icterohaemorrhagiae str. Verdun HP]